jgi:homoserine dehydrogenase
LSAFAFVGMLARPLMQTVNIGLIGGGTVGGGVYKALRRNGALMASRLGVRLRVARVAVRNVRKARAVKLPRAILTSNWESVVTDPKIDLVAELMGGTTTAREVALTALRAGKPVVTANKALLAFHGEQLFKAARRHDANLYYEASVAGGIPIIKVLREGLGGNRITRLYGILNGTCNFILTQMQEREVDFDEAVAEAQAQGFAEADASLDVDGHDAAHKAGILASLAHGFWVNPKRVYTEGIRRITPLDLEFAETLGYTIKLLGIVKGNGGSPVQVSVYPALIPSGHVMASVGGVFNAILVRGDVVGDTLYYGQGAGQDATASAVLSDLADAALDLKHGTPDRRHAFVPHDANGAVQSIDAVSFSFYLRLSVVDRPGVLAQVASILARGNIGISSVIQPEGHEGASVPLILMIHDAPNAGMQKALATIRRMKSVKGDPVLLRVEDFS